jgi:hypothetical protein
VPSTSLPPPDVVLAAVEAPDVDADVDVESSLELPQPAASAAAPHAATAAIVRVTLFIRISSYLLL